MKNLTPAVLNALKGHHSFVHLLRFNFVGLALGFTEGGHDVEFDGLVYESNGLLTEMDDITSSAEQKVGTFKVGFSAVDSTILAILSNDRQFNQLVHVTRAYLNDDGQIIPDPIHLHTFLIASHDVESDSSTAKVIVTLTSEFGNFDVKNGRRTTPASQKKHFVGDQGFYYASAAPGKTLWGSRK